MALKRQLYSYFDWKHSSSWDWTSATLGVFVDLDYFGLFLFPFLLKPRKLVVRESPCSDGWLAGVERGLNFTVKKMASCLLWFHYEKGLRNKTGRQKRVLRVQVFPAEVGRTGWTVSESRQGGKDSWWNARDLKSEHERKKYWRNWIKTDDYLSFLASSTSHSVRTWCEKALVER